MKTYKSTGQRWTKVRLKILRATWSRHSDPLGSRLISCKLQIYAVVLLASSISLVALTPQGFAQSSEWLTPTAPVVSWTDAGNHVGQYVTVQGMIVRTFYYFPQYYYDGAYFLVLGTLYQGYFYGVILSSDSVNFKCSITQFYLNKDVRITGTIQLYNGAPEIIVSSPSQIEVAYMGYPCS